MEAEPPRHSRRPVREPVHSASCMNACALLAADLSEDLCALQTMLGSEIFQKHRPEGTAGLSRLQDLDRITQSVAALSRVLAHLAAQLPAAELNRADIAKAAAMPSIAARLIEAAYASNDAAKQSGPGDIQFFES